MHGNKTFGYFEVIYTQSYYISYITGHEWVL